MNWFRKLGSTEPAKLPKTASSPRQSSDPSQVSSLEIGTVKVNAKDGTKMVWIPPGEFDMGDGTSENCPKHKVWLDGYWIGVYCVTNKQYSRFVKDGKGRAPHVYNWDDPEFALHPVVSVEWEDAMAYANWAGLALPTEAQWEKACRGPKGLVFPWGNEWDGTRCQHRGSSGDKPTAPVAAYPSGVSGYGTFQQCGNVLEWCADWYDEKFYTQSDASRNPVGPRSGEDHVRRGGCWAFPPDPETDGVFRGTWRESSNQGGNFTGFRLAGRP